MAPYRKNVLGSYITNAVVSSAVLEYCIALQIWLFTQPGNKATLNKKFVPV